METSRKIFFKDSQDGHLAEALRVIRSNIHFTTEKEKNVLVFTSTIPKEGKSTIAANYAMSVAISGKKVLLLDCDIRRPRAHTSFGVDVESGFGDVLMGRRDVDEVILKNVEKNLDILPSNHISHNVTELFLGKEMRNIIEVLKTRYDLIVLDTPPLMVATDAAILGEYSDGIVYIVGYNMVSKKELTICKKMLERSGSKIIGSVVNKIEKSGYSYGNYGYYNNSYSYYKDYIGGN